MNNLYANIQKLFLNRNFVTILGVIAGVIVLWFVYSSVLSKAIDPIKVPVAKKDLTAGTQITQDDIEFVEVNSDAISKTAIIKSTSLIVNYYVKNGTSIPKGSMFYKSDVVEKGDLIIRDNELLDDGELVFILKVTRDTTYANSIYPGDKIDLWIYTQKDKKIVFEKFVEGIEVLSVKDKNNQNVFDVRTGREPAYLRFAVDKKTYQYLTTIQEVIPTMELQPVPRSKEYYDEDTKAKIVNDQILDLIDSMTLDYASQFGDNNTEETESNGEATE